VCATAPSPLSWEANLSPSKAEQACFFTLLIASWQEKLCFFIQECSGRSAQPARGRPKSDFPVCLQRPRLLPPLQMEEPLGKMYKKMPGFLPPEKHKGAPSPSWPSNFYFC